MTRPRLLDLFCGAGGAATGYHRVGFEVLGVDHLPQKNYPFPFVQADALEFLARQPPGRFDLIDASPPCQRYSRAQVLHGREHPDLLPAVRAALIAAGKPYVIENVVGAPLIHPSLLCSLHFGLKVFRHRLFETDGWLMSMPHVPHGDRRIGKDGFCWPAGHGDSGSRSIPADHRRVDCWREAMGIDWMTRHEFSQAIPPAYTTFVGAALLDAMR